MPWVIEKVTAVENYNGGSVGAVVADKPPHWEGGYAEYASGGRSGTCASMGVSPWPANNSGTHEPRFYWRGGTVEDYDGPVDFEVWFRFNQGTNPPSNFDQVSGASRLVQPHAELLRASNDFQINLEIPITDPDGPRPVLTGAPPILRVNNGEFPNDVILTTTVPWGTWFRVRADYLNNTLQVGSATTPFTRSTDFGWTGRYLYNAPEWYGSNTETYVAGWYAGIRADDFSISYNRRYRVPPPPPTMTTPADGSVSTVRRPTFGGTRPPGDVVYIEVYNDADDSWLAWTSDVEPDDIIWQVLSSYTLSPGIYTVYARQYDGMWSAESNRVTFRIVAPDIAVTRMYPRDDAIGLGSAPRIHPPPKRGRLVGGYQ